MPTSPWCLRGVTHFRTNRDTFFDDSLGIGALKIPKPSQNFNQNLVKNVFLKFGESWMMLANNIIFNEKVT